jgi:hypothetical protein
LKERGRNNCERSYENNDLPDQRGSFTRKRLDVLPSLLCCAPLLERSLSSNSFHVEILGDVVNRLDWG